MDNNSYEHDVALRESSRIHSNDEYFKARPQIDNHDRRNVFDAGYDRGWQAAQQQSAGEIAELENSLQKIVEVLAAGADLNESYRKTIDAYEKAHKAALEEKSQANHDERLAYKHYHEIKADNERLREALLAASKYVDHMTPSSTLCKIISEALSATTQSLQAHDNSNKTMAGACGGQAGSFRALKGKQ